MENNTTDAIQIGERRSKLPTKWLIALLAGAIAVGGWIMKQQMEHDDLRERVQDLEERQEWMWGKR